MNEKIPMIRKLRKVFKAFPHEQLHTMIKSGVFVHGLTPTSHDHPKGSSNGRCCESALLWNGETNNKELSIEGSHTYARPSRN